MPLSIAAVPCTEATGPAHCTDDQSLHRQYQIWTFASPTIIEIGQQGRDNSEQLGNLSAAQQLALIQEGYDAMTKWDLAAGKPTFFTLPNANTNNDTIAAVEQQGYETYDRPGISDGGQLAVHRQRAVERGLRVVVGQPIDITSISQSGQTITVDGAGFSTLTVINFFNAQGGAVANLGGLNSDGSPKIPLTLINETEFQVQALNPPFIPFTSTGTNLNGSFGVVGQ